MSTNEINVSESEDSSFYTCEDCDFETCDDEDGAINHVKETKHTIMKSVASYIGTDEIFEQFS